MTRTQLETMREAIVMENEQIGEFVSEYKVPIDVFEAIIDVVSEAQKKEPEVVKRLAPIDEIHFMCDEAFKRGVMTGMYIFNESLKETFDDMKKDSDEQTATTETTK